MDQFTLQPTFSQDVRLSRDVLARRMQLAAEQVDFRQSLRVAGHCLEFMVDSGDQRFWSPHLSVQIQSEPNTQEAGTERRDHCEVFGRFSPRPEIWTMFMAIYGVILCSVLIAGIYGAVQWTLDSRPWALIFVPIGLLSVAAMHVLSKVGQKLSSDQMQVLHSRLDNLLKMATEPAENLSA